MLQANLNLKIRLHHFEPCSEANGPGKRAVIWFQGCSFAEKCPGCFNQGTHEPRAGQIVTLQELSDMIANADEAHDIDGITISGGEPLHQPEALLHLLTLLGTHEAFRLLNVVLLTGYSASELRRLRAKSGTVGQALRSFEHYVSVLIAGRYDHEQRIANHFIGSANKEIIFIDGQYSEDDFAKVPECELTVNADGTVTVTGIDPVLMNMLEDYL